MESSSPSEIVFAKLTSLNPLEFTVHQKLVLSFEWHNLSMPIEDQFQYHDKNEENNTSCSGCPYDCGESKVSNAMGSGTYGRILQVGATYAFFKNAGGQTYHFLYRTK